MILDDIFSALDHSTAMAVFNGLFGETGMLREAGCTTILATHLRKLRTVARDYATLLMVYSQPNVWIQPTKSLCSMVREVAF